MEEADASHEVFVLAKGLEGLEGLVGRPCRSNCKKTSLRCVGKQVVCDFKPGDGDVAARI